MLCFTRRTDMSDNLTDGDGQDGIEVAITIEQDMTDGLPYRVRLSKVDGDFEFDHWMTEGQLRQLKKLILISLREPRR